MTQAKVIPCCGCSSQLRVSQVPTFGQKKVLLKQMREMAARIKG